MTVSSVSTSGSRSSGSIIGSSQRKDKESHSCSICRRRWFWILVIFLALAGASAALYFTVLKDKFFGGESSAQQAAQPGNNRPPALASPVPTPSPALQMSQTNAPSRQLSQTSPFPTDRGKTPPPSPFPTVVATTSPIVALEMAPAPTFPLPEPTNGDGDVEPLLAFYAIADVPYSDRIRGALVNQVLALQSNNIDFMIHLGDIKAAEEVCTEDSFADIDSVLIDSPVPVFVVVGDNEYNDCPNIGTDDAMKMWLQYYERYDVKYKAHNMRVEQHPNRPEVFMIVHKRTLFFGLNLVGGTITDQNEWYLRHAQQIQWVQQVMLNEVNNVDSVVFFAHADPTRAHSDFFNPLSSFLQNDFPTNIPLLYMCGDAHAWSYDTEYLFLENMLRVRLTGGVNEPIVRVTIDATPGDGNAETTFQVDRFLTE